MNTGAISLIDGKSRHRQVEGLILSYKSLLLWEPFPRAVVLILWIALDPFESQTALSQRLPMAIGEQIFIL